MNATPSERFAGSLSTRPVALCLALTLTAACGGGDGNRTPAAPTPPAAPPVSTYSTTARVVSTLDSTLGIGGATIAGDQIAQCRSGDDGYVTLQANAPLMSAVNVSSDSWVERRTFLQVPGAETTLSLIPGNFNLTYFDEMCRAFGAVRRWIAAPALVVETAVLQYGSRIASEDAVPEDVIERTVAQLRGALLVQSAKRFSEFASTEVRRTPAGAASAVPSGAIALTWQRGLLTGFGHVAYGGRSGGADGGLNRGEVALDFDWYVHGLPAGSRRDFVYVVQHEFGHALGYSHTKVPPSFMYEVYLMTISAQDLQAFEIVMQRRNGNRTPDMDPSGSSLNLTGSSQPMDIPRCAFLAARGR